MSECWPEVELIRRIEDGDDRAFDELRSRSERTLERLLRPLTRDSNELGDIVQITWIRAYKAIRSHKYNDEGRFIPWLSRIARHLVCDTRRTGKRTITISDGFDVADHAASPEDSAMLRSVLGFLETQLAEAVGFQPGKVVVNGEENLKYLAFLYFYRDGFTIDEVEQLLAQEAQLTSRPSPSYHTLNNWLSGGRLLRKLVEHLVVNHPETLDKLSDKLILSARLGRKQSAHWLNVSNHGPIKPCDNDSPLKLDSADIAKITALLHKEIFQALHDARKKGTAIPR